MKIRILGRGKVGRSLAKAWGPTYRVEVVPGRAAPRKRQPVDVWVLAVPDGAVSTVAAAIAPHVTSGAVVLHCAGSLGPEVLQPCSEAGASIGAMHPLVSFADGKKPPPLTDATFVIRGDNRAVRVARRLADAAGARPLVADLQGPAYHAVAALVANGSAALAAAGVRVLEALEVDTRAAQRALAALLRSVAHNVEQVGVPEALTGPVARGDVETVKAHRKALKRLDRGAAEAYGAVAPVILDCARRAGLAPGAVRRLRAVLAAG